MKQKEVKEKAHKYLNALKDHMLQIQEDKNRETFNKSIMNGHRLTVDELRNLKSTWKRDYFLHMIGIDNDIKYLINHT